MANHEVADVKEQLDITNKKISSCVEMVTSTDEALRQLLVSTIDEIFSLDMTSGPIDENYVAERKAQLNRMVEEATGTLNKLKAYFQEKCYDMGIPLDIQFVNEMMPFIGALGLSFDSHYEGQHFTNTSLLINEFEACPIHKVFKITCYII